MTDRQLTPIRNMTPADFRSRYFLKEELADFCRGNALPASGSKTELTERIAHWLETGEVIERNRTSRTRFVPAVITPETPIEPDIVCSQTHRAFFVEQIGRGFRFSTRFQNWLKENAGKTNAGAIDAYRRIQSEDAAGRKQIGAQFEYNSYIRDFFEDEPKGTLEEAIRCWKYKRDLPGPHRFDPSDREAVRRIGGTSAGEDK